MSKDLWSFDDAPSGAVGATTPVSTTSTAVASAVLMPVSKGPLTPTPTNSPLPSSLPPSQQQQQQLSTPSSLTVDTTHSSSTSSPSLFLVLHETTLHKLGGNLTPELYPIVERSLATKLGDKRSVSLLAVSGGGLIFTIPVTAPTDLISGVTDGNGGAVTCYALSNSSTVLCLVSKRGGVDAANDLETFHTELLTYATAKLNDTSCDASDWYKQCVESVQSTAREITPENLRKLLLGIPIRSGGVAALSPNLRVIPSSGEVHPETGMVVVDRLCEVWAEEIRRSAAVSAAGAKAACERVRMTATKELNRARLLLAQAATSHHAMYQFVAEMRDAGGEASVIYGLLLSPGGCETIDTLQSAVLALKSLQQNITPFEHLRRFPTTPLVH